MHFLSPSFWTFSWTFFWNPFFGTLLSTFFWDFFIISFLDFFGILSWHSFDYFFMGINFHWHHFEYFEKLQDYFVHFFWPPFTSFFTLLFSTFLKTGGGVELLFGHHLRSSKKYLKSICGHQADDLSFPFLSSAIPSEIYQIIEL